MLGLGCVRWRYRVVALYQLDTSYYVGTWRAKAAILPLPRRKTPRPSPDRPVLNRLIIVAVSLFEGEDMIRGRGHP